MFDEKNEYWSSNRFAWMYYFFTHLRRGFLLTFTAGSSCDLQMCNVVKSGDAVMAAAMEMD